METPQIIGDEELLTMTEEEAERFLDKELRSDELLSLMYLEEQLCSFGEVSFSL